MVDGRAVALEREQRADVVVPLLVTVFVLVGAGEWDER